MYFYLHNWSYRLGHGTAFLESWVGYKGSIEATRIGFRENKWFVWKSSIKCVDVVS